MSRIPTYLREAMKAVKAKALANDSEAAHSKEDELHRDALRWIAKCVEGVANAEEASDSLVAIRQVAKYALSTSRLKFQRWCA